MSEKPVQTVNGPFDRKRLKSMKDAIKDQDRDTVVVWEGMELLVSYAEYMIEFVELEFGKRNTGGL